MMERPPAIRTAVVGVQYPGRVVIVAEDALYLELELTHLAVLRFDQTVTPERARRLAPGDPVEAVLVRVLRYPNDVRLIASLPANPAWLTWNDETVRRLA